MDDLDELIEGMALGSGKLLGAIVKVPFYAAGSFFDSLLE